MHSRTLRHGLAVGLAVLLSALGACNCNKSAPEASDQDQEESAEASEPTAQEGNSEQANGDEGSSAESASADQGNSAGEQYPTMNLEELDTEDRETFVSVAKGELCPCPQSTESLHKCLQAPDATCSLAKKSATAMSRGLEAGLSKTDLQDRLAELVDRSKKEHEFTLEDVPHKGSTDAPVKVVEFADFRCPHCRKASKLMEELMETYEGDVVHYFKHFPLSAQGGSKVAARAAVAAHRQGKFWPMHDLIFEHQKSLSRDKIMGFARRIGLNFEKFKSDLDSEEISQVVARDKQEGNRAGIRGTPAFYINGREYMGAVTKNGLKDAIEAALEAQKQD